MWFNQFLTITDEVIRLGLSILPIKIYICKQLSEFYLIKGTTQTEPEDIINNSMSRVSYQIVLISEKIMPQTGLQEVYPIKNGGIFNFVFSYANYEIVLK